MSAVYDCLSLHQCAKKLIGDLLFSLIVQAACGLIEEEDRSILFQETSRNQDSLLFSTGENATEISNLCFVTLFHANYFIVDFALLANFLNFLQGCIRVAVFQVEKNGVVKKFAVLWNNADVLSEALKFKISHILSIDGNRTFFWIIESQQKIEECGLSKTTWTNNCIGSPWLNFKREVIK